MAHCLEAVIISVWPMNNGAYCLLEGKTFGTRELSEKRVQAGETGELKCEVQAHGAVRKPNVQGGVQRNELWRSKLLMIQRGQNS